jgi:hypothetical protein
MAEDLKRAALLKQRERKDKLCDEKCTEQILETERELL